MYERKDKIQDKSESYVVEIEAVGVQESTLTIEVEGDLLNISSVTSDQKNDDQGELVWQEFAIKPLKRSYHLPHDVDRDNISANLRDGILTVDIPKTLKSIIKIEVNGSLSDAETASNAQG
jgi:HSP20 family protein